MTQRPIRYVRSRDTLTRSVGDVVLVAARRSGRIERMSGTSAAGWASLANPLTEFEMASRLADTYGVEPERIAADVHSLLEEMLEKGLIEEAGQDV